ncbi:HNH endonuclease [Marinagarivorans algicola]|uniref:HNH endonuclease n=1 Tax=Marinagarivorans algicola TaxID=1513270 RepID=UPI0006B9F208|nr:HNH endonuclease signature motif containing protein [Marinagarivorans algicola]
MKDILSKCHDFNFSESYAFADKVRKAIFENDYFIEPVGVASDIENQIKKPQKQTILHDYIGCIVESELTFHFRGPAWGYDCVEPIFEYLKTHKIKYLTLSEYIEEQYRDDDTGETVLVTEDLMEKHKVEHALDYLEEHAVTELGKILVKEVFTLLFSDREAMKAFNIKIAEYLGERTERCRYWPKWLERALFCREKGLCAICKADLSSMFHVHGKLAIDHIVPIAMFGVNDPTNLQILCEECNSRKSGNKITTSNAIPVYW